jgi:GNAT superfamily N-acetyltransferase
MRRRARRHGLGAALIRAAEDVARAAGRTLLVLDTVTGYALMPRGGLCDTTVFYRVLT